MYDHKMAADKNTDKSDEFITDWVY